LAYVKKYLSHLYREIDISPLDRTCSAFRTIIFLTWSVNALIFLTIDFLPLDDFITHTSEQNLSKYTIELSSADVHPDIQIIFYTIPLGIVSSNDVNSFEFEINTLEHDRSPPL
jgi:hypothetical protein